MITSQERYKTRMLGVVTLYNFDSKAAAENIKRYIHDLDALIIWDNSPLEKGLKDGVLQLLGEEADKVVWHGDGINSCIAPAINFAWKYAKENGFNLLLIMDQDSKWENFASYRKDVECLYAKESMIFTPFVVGCDFFDRSVSIHPRWMFINSGSIIPVEILESIGGIDEQAFPLDAIDYDMAFNVQKKGYKIVCLTAHSLFHTLGDYKRMGIFKMRTSNYGCERRYSIMRSHVICYRKHRKGALLAYKKHFFKIFLYDAPMRILLAEPDKVNRFKAFVKGLISGLKYRI